MVPATLGNGLLAAGSRMNSHRGTPSVRVFEGPSKENPDRGEPVLGSSILAVKVRLWAHEIIRGL